MCIRDSPYKICQYVVYIDINIDIDTGFLTYRRNTKHEKKMKNADQTQVTVYHIAIPHQEEIWGEWLPEIERFLPEVELIFFGIYNIHGEW